MNVTDYLCLFLKEMSAKADDVICPQSIGNQLRTKIIIENMLIRLRVQSVYEQIQKSFFASTSLVLLKNFRSLGFIYV